MTVAQKIIVWWDKPSSPAFRDLKRKDHGYESIPSNTDILSEKIKENKGDRRDYSRGGEELGEERRRGRERRGNMRVEKLLPFPWH